MISEKLGNMAVCVSVLLCYYCVPFFKLVKKLIFFDVHVKCMFL